MQRLNLWTETLNNLCTRLSSLCPDFVVTGTPFRTAKCALVEGLFDGKPAIAKTLGPRIQPWDWYFARELSIYRQLTTPPVRIPTLLFAAEVEQVMILSRFDSAVPLSLTRERTHPLGASVLSMLLHSLTLWREAAAIRAKDLASPNPSTQSKLRERLLEDPTAPLAWITEGLRRSCELELLDAQSVDDALAALDEATGDNSVCYSHGDLLLRNVLQCKDGALAWIDLECSGFHASGWDLGLLWANVHDEDRPMLEKFASESPLPHSVSKLRAFYACALFAIARELLYRSRRSAHNRRSQRLLADRAQLALLLRNLARG